MTLTNRKGNIRGREFPTDTGIDGNACEETTKDQRWVGYRHQIPNPDTTNLYSPHLSSPKVRPSDPFDITTTAIRGIVSTMD